MSAGLTTRQTDAERAMEARLRAAKPPEDRLSWPAAVIVIGALALVAWAAVLGAWLS